MVAQNSGIKDKEKLKKYLYTNPDKLALKLLQFTKDKKGHALPHVKLKGTGQGYYYSINHKRLIRASRDAEFYLLPWDDGEDDRRCYIYTHYNWMVGCIFRVFKSDIIHLGDN
tara:strand:- start:276 stop:614 length:339 start_codon:yes stop_codon:yes gene_type:complete